MGRHLVFLSASNTETDLFTSKRSIAIAFFLFIVLPLGLVVLATRFIGYDEQDNKYLTFASCAAMEADYGPVTAASKLCSGEGLSEEAKRLFDASSPDADDTVAKAALLAQAESSLTLAHTFVVVNGDGQMGDGPFTAEDVKGFARTPCRKYAFCRLTPWRLSAWLVMAVSSAVGLLGLVVLVRGKWAHALPADGDGDVEMADNLVAAGSDRSESPGPRVERANSITIDEFAEAAGFTKKQDEHGGGAGSADAVAMM